MCFDKLSGQKLPGATRSGRAGCIGGGLQQESTQSTGTSVLSTGTCGSS